ncbi:MAG: AAA family ATPase [Nitrospinae bacterium]|nr:AAA family ATPase [Nitrospinota bacterium]
MPEEKANNGLHLPDLVIRGFRGIKDLSIPKLGRVTLLAGKNSVGKTTLLEALSIFASRGRYSILSSVLARHDEMSKLLDEDDIEIETPNIIALFHGWDVTRNTSIVIGPSEKAGQLRIEKTFLTDKQLQLPGLEMLELFGDGEFQSFKVSYRDKEHMLPWFDVSQGTEGANFKNPRLHRNMRRALIKSDMPMEIKCETLGPSLLETNRIARFWDGIALTDGEEHAVDALRLIFGNKVERIALTAEEFKQHGRRIIVKLKGRSHPVPLKSLGDGAVRLFSVALTLTNVKDGILLIDEAENGIHHSIQPDFWRMVLRMARENNIQVLATTHSWDCVRGFAQAAADDQDAEGVLYRLERDDEDIWAVFYPEDQLKIAAEQGTEVR